MDYGDSNFPGMYSADNNIKNNDSDFSDESHDKHSKKDLLVGKKKDKKDKGYATLEGESSPEEELDANSPSKSKKLKPFKFSSKKEKREKSKEKENKEIEKDKKKDKEKIKFKYKDKKKVKNSDSNLDICEELPIFGVPLLVAVQRNPCHDGVKIPLVIRNCVDYVQIYGLTVEGVYKISGIKSRVHHVYTLYNKRQTVYESDFDLTIATSLLKQFLRLLPEPILTNTLHNKFEDINAVKEPATLKCLIKNLPECNQDLLKWLFIHFKNICTNEKYNKMNAASLGTIFCPLLQMSSRLFSIMITWTEELFPNYILTRYVPPMRSVSPNMPTDLESVSSELMKQESLLCQIHFEMNAGFISKEKEDELWGVQRNITQLKRKLKLLDKEFQQKNSKLTESISVGDIDKDEEAETATNASDSSVNVLTEKINENTGIDTTPNADESVDKPIIQESSPKNINTPSNEINVEDNYEEQALQFESIELINLVKSLQEEIKTERLRINQLKSKLNTVKINTSVTECLTDFQEDTLFKKENEESIREYNMLQSQKKKLLQSIMEERELIIDLKVQISMTQYKNKQSKLLLEL